MAWVLNPPHWIDPWWCCQIKDVCDAWVYWYLIWTESIWYGIVAPIRDRKFLIQLECWDTVTVVVQHPPQSYEFWLPLILEWFSIKTRTPKTTAWMIIFSFVRRPQRSPDAGPSCDRCTFVEFLSASKVRQTKAQWSKEGSALDYSRIGWRPSQVVKTLQTSSC